jgi:RNA polymerase sigma-70 factor, ECF subfamily
MPDSGPISSTEILRHMDFVRTLARALTDDRFLADDLAQDALLSAIEHPPARGANLRAWLTVVVKNRWRFLLRSRHRRDDTLKRFVERTEDDLATRREASDVVRGQSGSPELADAFLALAPRYREVLLLRYWKDMPPREIAVELGVPLHTVKTRLQRGLARLRERNLDRERRWSPAALWLALSDRVAEWWPASLRPLSAQAFGLIAVLGVVATTAVLIQTPGSEGDSHLERPEIGALAALENGQPARSDSSAASSPQAKSNPKPEPEPAGAPAALSAPRARLVRLNLRDRDQGVLSNARAWIGDRVVARSDERGELVFAAPAEALVIIDHPRCLPRSARVSELCRQEGARVKTELILAPAYRYEIQVRDRRTGRALVETQCQVRLGCFLEDATTRLAEGRPIDIRDLVASGGAAKIDQHRFPAEFDHEARTVIPVEPHSMRNLRVAAPGYVTASLPLHSGEKGGEKLIVELVAASRLELTSPGEESGRLVARFLALDGLERNSSDHRILELREGAAVLQDLPPGNYRALFALWPEGSEIDEQELWQMKWDATARSAHRFEYARIEMRDDGPTQHQLFASRGRRLFVRGPDVAGARLELHLREPGREDAVRTEESRVARVSSSSAEFESVTAGRYRLCLIRHGRLEREIDLEVSRDAHALISIELQRGEAELCLAESGTGASAWWRLPVSRSARAEGAGLHLTAARHHAHPAGAELCLSRLPVGPGELWWIEAGQLERRRQRLTPGRHAWQRGSPEAVESFSLDLRLDKLSGIFSPEQLVLRDDLGRDLALCWEEPDPAAPRWIGQGAYRRQVSARQRSLRLRLPAGVYWLGDLSWQGQSRRLDHHADRKMEFRPVERVERPFRLLDESGVPLRYMPASMNLARHHAPVHDLVMPAFSGCTDGEGRFVGWILPHTDQVIDLADGRRVFLRVADLVEEGGSEGEKRDHRPEVEVTVPSR